MEPPLRQLTTDEVETYQRDGAICARGLFDEKWIARMAGAVDRVFEHPTAFGDVQNRPGEGFANDLFMWQTDDDFRDFVLDSPAAAYAHQVLASKSVRFFYDQLFVKQVGTHTPTPWHQDVTFWPVRGEQICSIWMPFDRVTRESSGLEFVRGSHKWPNRYKAVTPDHNPYMLDSDLEDPPDVEQHRDEYDLLCWDLDPGDALIFSPVTLHGSSGNYSTERPRRALATRWFGDDVVWAPGKARMPVLWKTGLQAGDPVRGPVFPQVYPQVIENEVAARLQAPQPPDAGIVDKLRGTKA